MSTIALGIVQMFPYNWPLASKTILLLIVETSTFLKLSVQYWVQINLRLFAEAVKIVCIDSFSSSTI